MAHGLNSVLKRGNNSVGCNKGGEGKTGIGSRRIFAPHFKLQVLDSYRNDSDCKGNQRATARKYGIHRRQIQKWLQVENNLRNSVGKCKSDNNSENPEARKCSVDVTLVNCGHRQRDDSSADPYAYNEPRVPCLSPVLHAPEPTQCSWPPEDNPPVNNSGSSSRLTPLALDFSTHSRGHGSPIVANPEASPSPADPAAPIDLSLKKVGIVAAGASAAPVPASPLTPPPVQLLSPHSLVQPHPDVWDLSTKGINKKCEDGSFPAALAPTLSSATSSTPPKPVKLFKPYLDNVNDDNVNDNDDVHNASYQRDLTPPSCCTSAYLVQANCDSLYYNNNNNNNNNNVCDIKSEYSYTIHELQPKSYYYTPCISYQADYEMHDYCPSYEDISYSQGLTPLKQRQSYSLDFKLSAIDCYYQDSVCRGNQRAVASKYNIHRRQVQKWLKQAEELRQRNENIKQINAVVS